MFGLIATVRTGCTASVYQTGTENGKTKLDAHLIL